jgi:hypothetical protein
MKRFLFCCICTILFADCAHLKAYFTRRPAAEPPPSFFDMAAFDRTCVLADALAHDDIAAWRSTDSIMAEKPILLDSLDRTWFVDVRDGVRYVFYGRYTAEDSAYHVKYAYMEEQDGRLQRIPAVADERAGRFARAVSTGERFFRTCIDSMRLNVDYNHYIRENGDGSYGMWFFPSGYGNYCAHGVDFHIVIDPTGHTVTDHAVTGGYLRYFELNKKTQTVELDNTYDSIPSLGNVFFALVNRERFDSIVIVNRGSTSTVKYSPEKREWEWVHAARK